MNKIRLMVLMMIMLLLSVGTYASNYYINDTTLNLKKSAAEYNYYAEQFYKKTKIKPFFCVTISRGEVGTFLESKKNKVFENVLKDNINENILVVVLELNSMQGKAAKNFNNEAIKLKPIATDLFISEFDFLPLVLNQEGTEVVDVKQQVSEQQKIDAVGKLGVNLLYGLSGQLGVDVLPNKITSQIKERNKMSKLYDLYTKKKEENNKNKLVKQEEKSTKGKKEESEKTKTEKTESKKQEQFQKEIEDKKKREKIANKWNTKLNLSLGTNYLNEKTDEESLTGRVKTEKSELTSTVTLKPTMVSQENGVIETSASLKDYRNFMISEENDLKARYDYTRGKLYGDTYTLEFSVGDINLENDAYIILNKKYRGYYAGIQYYLNYNPEKWSYKEKVKEGEITDKSVKGIRISGLYAPSDKEKFLGDVASETDTGYETKGFLSEIFIKNKMPKNTQEYHLGYVYGGATQEEGVIKLNNYAQMLIAEGKIVELNRYLLKMSGQVTSAERETYNLTSNAVEKKSGERVEAAASLNTVQGKDYMNMQARGYYSGDGFDTGLLSKLSGGVPEYVQKDNLQNGYGYELKFSNSLFDKKIENAAGIAINEKRENGESLGSYKKFFLQNKYVFNENAALYTGYNTYVDFDEKRNQFNLRYSQNYKELFGVSYDGNFVPSFEYKNRYFNEEKVEEKYGLKIADASTLKFKQFSIPNTITHYQSIMPLTKEYSNGLNMYGRVFAKENISYNDIVTGEVKEKSEDVEKFKTSLGQAYYSKNDIDKIDYIGLSDRVMSNLIINDEFNLFKEDIVLNYNWNNYFYNRNKNEINTANLLGLNSLVTAPLRREKFTSYNLFNGKMNKNDSDVANTQQSNFLYKTNNEYKIDNKMTVFGNYKFVDNTTQGVVPTKASMDIYDPDNAGTITDINSQISENESIIERENLLMHDIETGLKYRVKGEEELTEQNPLQIQVGISGGYEIKEVKEAATRVTISESQAIYAGMLTEGRYYLNKYNQAAWKGSVKPAFDNKNSGGLLKTKYEAVAGIKTQALKFQNTTSLNVNQEIYEDGITENTTEIEMSSLGGYKINPKNVLQYKISYKDKSLTDSRSGKIELAFKSNIYKAADKQEEIKKIEQLGDVAEELKADMIEEIKSKREFVSSTDIFVNTNINYKKDAISEISLYQIISGGTVAFYEGLNVFNVTGSFTRKIEDTMIEAEEYSKFSIRDSQRIGSDMNLATMAEYYVYNNGTPADENKKIIISANISKVFFKYFSAGLNAQQETELKKDYNKDKKLYGAFIKASF